MYKVLVASDNRALSNELEEIVHGVEGLIDPVITKLKSAKTTLQELSKSQPSIVFIDAHIRFAHDSDENIGGYDLAKEILDRAADLRIAPPKIIVMLDGPTDRISESIFSDNLCLVEKSTLLSLKIRQILKNHSDSRMDDSQNTGAAEIDRYRKKVVFNIRPILHETSWDVNWEIWCDGCKTVESHVEAVRVSDGRIKALINDTAHLDYLFDMLKSVEHEKWQQDFRAIGEELSKLLFDDLRLSTRISDITQERTDIKDIAYRFIVDNRSVGVALEASLGPSGKDYLFETAPLFRSLSGGEKRRESEGNCDTVKRPLRVLIIEANACGQSDILAQQFEDLGASVQNECTLLEEFFSEELQVNFSDDNNYSFDNSVRLSQSNYRLINNSSTFREALFFLLESRSWDVVHYAGHSIVTKEKKKAYLILPSEGEGVDELPVAQMKHSIKFFNLLFMSSCLSASEQFSLELQGSNIAKFIGYRWKVDTRETIRFCELFYKNYLKKRESAPAAFSHARRDVFYEIEESTVWASPILCVSNLSDSYMN